jgi:hypothetical protein
VQPVQNQHVQNFAKIVARLEEHNKRYNPIALSGPWVANILRSALAEQEVHVIPQEPSSPAQEAEAIFKEFSRTLQAMGLEVVQNRAESDLAQLSEKCGLEQQAIQRLKSSTLSFEVADDEALVKFFRSITSRDLEGDGVKSAVDYLARALDEEFLHQYMRTHLDPAAVRWKELQAPLLEVASELSRLNLKEAAARVTLQIQQAIDGALSEYLIAESMNILVDTETFNARKWHRDTTQEKYQKHWDEAIDAARRINDNPKAVRIFDRVHSFLKESAEFAKGEIEKNIANPPPNYAKGYWTEGGPEKLETLKNVLRDLAILRPERDE